MGVAYCPDQSENRKNLLAKLKNLVCQIDDNCCFPCGPPCPPSVPTCIQGPVIEIYDPLPKPCIPICRPNFSPSIPCGPCEPCEPCPPSREYCPGTCPTPSNPVPVCLPRGRCSVMVPPILPICTPCNPPCVPICNPYPTEQPCVPCNPPQMMVCYRKPKNGIPLNKSKSVELRAGIMYVGCDCERLNGLQDDCRRAECQGAPPCMTMPHPSCGPSSYALGKHLGRKYGRVSNDLEEYQCYPAYIRLPSAPPCGQYSPTDWPNSTRDPCEPCVPYEPYRPSCQPDPYGACPQPCAPCPPCPRPYMPCFPPPPVIPLIAAAPCPPPICPSPPPLVPLGKIVPVSRCMPTCPVPPPLACCPPSCSPVVPPGNSLLCCPPCFSPPLCPTAFCDHPACGICPPLACC